MQYDVLNRIMGSSYGIKSMMAEQYGVNRKTIERYIKCSKLEDCMLKLLNEGRFNIVTAVHLADLSVGNQSVLADWLNENPKAQITAKAAQQLISKNGFGFDESDISEIVLGKPSKSKDKPTKAAIIEPVESEAQETEPTVDFFNNDCAMVEKPVETC